MTESLVSASELKDYMSGIGLDADQTAAAQDILDGLQRQLERYCQRPLGGFVEHTETLVPDEYGRLWPTYTPVQTITVPATGLVARGNYISGASLSTFVFASAVTVTYTAGIDPDTLADARLAILRAAAREVQYRHDDVLDVSELRARPVISPDRRQPGFMPDELAQFDRLRRRTVI